METLSHAVGRDPVIHHAVYKVSQTIADFDHSSGSEDSHAQALVWAANRLFDAADRLVTSDESPSLDELRRSILELVIMCEQVANQSDGQLVDTHALSVVLDAVVHAYGVFELYEEANIFDERMGGRP